MIFNAKCFIRYGTVLAEEPITIQVMALPLAPATVPQTAASAARFTPLEHMLHELAQAFWGSYRPERHYMRGSVRNGASEMPQNTRTGWTYFEHGR